MSESEMLLEIQTKLGLPIPENTPPAFFDAGLAMLDSARKLTDDVERDQAFKEFRQWTDSIHAAFG